MTARTPKRSDSVDPIGVHVDDGVAEAVGLLARLVRDGLPIPGHVEPVSDARLVAVARPGHDHEPLTDVGDRPGVLVGHLLVEHVQRDPSLEEAAVVAARQHVEVVLVQELGDLHHGVEAAGSLARTSIECS